jgi:hypothetical protein
MEQAATSTDRPLTILLTNIWLDGRSGTEVVAAELAEGLLRAGHRPILYTTRKGILARSLVDRGLVVLDRLADLSARPDVIHGHHGPPTMAALIALPGVPALFVCHDARSAFDEPPFHPRVRRYFAVDELCRARLISAGLSAASVDLLPNAFDPERIQRRPPLPPRPRRALVLAKDRGHLPAVRSACARAGLMLEEMGPATGRISDTLGDELPHFDLVFASARMALEAAAAGCAVIVCDGRGMAGPLTLKAAAAWLPWNLGLGVLTFSPTREALAHAISAYDPAEAAAVTDLIRAERPLPALISRLEAIYRELAAEPLVSSPAAEAAAVARYLEDHISTPQLEAAWHAPIPRPSTGSPLLDRLGAAYRDRLPIRLRVQVRRWLGLPT